MATSYLQRISKDADAKKKQGLKDAAEDAAIQVKADISAAKKAKREAQRDFDATLSAIPFDSAEVISAKRALKEVEEDLADLKEIEETYFSDAIPSEEETTTEA